jgi:hypothetical protein
MRTIRYVPAASFFVVAATCHTLGAQVSARAATPVPAVASAALRLSAHETRDQIKVDGLLDEAAWRAADPATGFVQSEPRTGEPATEPTEVRVLFDATTLYIGIRFSNL